MKRILALQHIWDDPPGYLGEIMQEHAILCEIVNVAQTPIPDPAQYDAVIALGGPQHANADEKYPYFVQEKAILRKVIEQDIPYLGICLGGQLLAHVLGAPVTQHTLTEIGFFEVQLTDEGKADPLFQGLPGHQQVIHWHQDVFDIPQRAVRLATSENTPNQAFRFGKRAYGLQYHIELTPHMLDTWLQYPDYKKEIVKTLGQDAPGLIERDRPSCYPIYREHTRILFENFLKISKCV